MNIESNNSALPDIEESRQSLLYAMAAVSRARESRDQPGARCDLLAAEIISGAFVANHGKAILGFMAATAGQAPKGVRCEA